MRQRFGKPLAVVENHKGPHTVVLDLPAPTALDCVVLQERIEYGELARDHVIEERLARPGSRSRRER